MRSMPSRRLRVARRFWSSSRAWGWGRGPRRVGPVEGCDGEWLPRRAGVQQEDGAVRREQVDEDAVDAVAEAARGTALLVLVEGLELGAERRRDRAARLDAERAEGRIALLP